MYKSNQTLALIVVLVLLARGAFSGQMFPPLKQQKVATNKEQPRPEDFPLQAEVRRRATTQSILSNNSLAAAACKDQKRYTAYLCKEAIAAAQRANQRVVAKINEHVYILAGPPLPPGVYPARSINDAKGFEFLTKDEKGKYQTIQYSILQEIKAPSPPAKEDH